MKSHSNTFAPVEDRFSGLIVNGEQLPILVEDHEIEQIKSMVEPFTHHRAEYFKLLVMGAARIVMRVPNIRHAGGL